MAGKKKDSDDYEVGFGKPPKEHRFPKGVSGNPSGRPRRPKFEKSEAKMLDEILAQRMTVNVNGKKMRILPEEVALRKYVQGLVSSGSFYALQGLKDHLRRRG